MRPSPVPASIRKWVPVGVVVMLGALSILLLEVDRRRSTAALHRTVSSVDNLTRARLLVMEAYLGSEQVESGNPTADPTRPVADLGIAADLLGDLLAGRTSLLGIDFTNPVGNPVLVSEVSSYTEGIVDLRGRLARGLLESRVERRVAFAAVQGQGDRVERVLYESLRLRLEDDARSQRYWLAGWAGFLLLASLLVTLARSESGRADKARRAAERSRARSEARFQALIEGSSEAVSIVAPDGTIQYESPAAERVLGHSAEERVGRSVFDLIHPDDVARVRDAFEQGIREEQSVSAEFRLRGRDGSWRIVSATGTSLLFDPAVEGMIINSRDITELRHNEDRLRQAQKMEAVGRLAGGIAHDFNNLLTVIRGNAAMALMELDPGSSAREDIEEVDRAADRAANLIRQLLAFSRQQMLRSEVLSFNAVVADVEKMLQRTLGEDIELVTILDPGVGMVRADPGQLQQILMNLAVNARDAMPEGGRLVMQTSNAEIGEDLAGSHDYEVKPGSYVLLEVSDTGTGIPDEVRERIFEPFFTTKPPGQGTGLGLSTVYGIVKQSSGYIWVRSEPGEGTMFRIFLPRVDDEATLPDPPRSRHAAGNGAMILLVEDEPAVRSTARRLLERMGHNVLEAGDGEAALAIAEERGGDIDLLLTDVVMPRMSGRELAERLTARWAGIRVLYASGYTDEAVVRHGVLEGSASFVQKPYEPDELAEKVALALDTRR